MFNTMKLRLIAVMCLLVAAQAQANDQKLQSSGGLYADLCVMAAESPEAFRSQLKANGLNAEGLICNGKPVTRFVKRIAAPSETVPASVFKAGNDDLFTQACLKGVAGETDWSDIKKALPREIDAYNVTCNGEPIRTFIRKHRG